MTFFIHNCNIRRRWPLYEKFLKLLSLFDKKGQEFHWTWASVHQELHALNVHWRVGDCKFSEKLPRVLQCAILFLSQLFWKLTLGWRGDWYDELHLGYWFLCYTKALIFAGGLYICLKTFVGFCERHINAYCEASGQKALVHLKHEKQAVECTDEPQDKVTKVLNATLVS